MAYTAWSVVYGEQPTAAKWNQLGANDAGFKDGTHIDDDAIIARHIANNAVSNAQMATDTFLWEKLADVTLGSAGDSLASGTFTSKKHLRFLVSIINSGALSVGLRFNGDSGNNYAMAYMSDAGSGNSVSQSSIAAVSGTGNYSGIGEVSHNNSGNQKLGFLQGILAGASAGTAPVNFHFKYVWNNTSSQITSIAMINMGAGDFAAGSRITVLGHD